MFCPRFSCISETKEQRNSSPLPCCPHAPGPSHFQLSDMGPTACQHSLCYQHPHNKTLCIPLLLRDLERPGLVKHSHHQVTPISCVIYKWPQPFPTTVLSQQQALIQPLKPSGDPLHGNLTHHHTYDPIAATEE